MATIPCNICSEKGTVQQGRDCPACDGAGEIEAPDGFHFDAAHQIAMYRRLIDIVGKLDDLDAKMDTLESHLDTIEAKIDML